MQIIFEFYKTKTMKFIIISLLHFFVCINIIQAQLVNIEKVRREQKEGFQGSANIALNLNQNVKQIFSFRNDVFLQYTKNTNTFMFINDINLMFVTDNDERENLINQNFQHLRYNYTFKESDFITYEFLLQRQENRIKFLDFRFITGTGLRFRLINNENIRLFLAPLFIYETEIEKHTEDLTRQTSLIKGNFYVNFLVKINDFLSFNTVAYYQPAFIDFNKYDGFEPVKNFRIAGESGFDFKIWEDKLVFSIVFDFSYDSSPPNLFFLEYDKEYMMFYTISNSIRFNF